MSDLLALARAVTARAEAASDPVSSFHALGGETLKQPLSATAFAGRMTALTEDIERSAICEIMGGIPREWATAFTVLLALPPPRGVAKDAWEEWMAAAGRLCERQTRRDQR